MESSVQNNISEKPRLKNYLNCIDFLNDYFNYRKKLNSKFSFELWSGELGFKSKSSIRMVCQGKRPITDALIEGICQHEKLDDSDKDYLQLLTCYHRVKSESLKKSIFEKILESYDVGEKQKEIKNYVKFLSSSRLPVIQLLISFTDFKATEKNLCEVLNLSSNSLKNYLNILEELELIQRVESEMSVEPYWISQNKLFRIPAGLANPSVHFFHQETMKEALVKAKAASEISKFRSLFFSLNEKNFNDLSETLDHFATRVKAEHCNDFIQKSRLYKLNFQLYPVTDEVEVK
jgi:uncharacterized protein (TIGR02147 family)